MAMINDPTGVPVSGANIKAGFPEVFVAPYGITLDATEDNGWRRVGVLVPGSLNMEFGKEVYAVKTGFPESTKAQFITGMSGMASFTVQEYTSMGLQIANGTAGTMFNPTYDSGFVTETTTAVSATKSQIKVATGGAIAAGDLLEIPQGNVTYGSWMNYVKVLGTSDSGGTTTVTLDGETDMLTASGADIKRITGWSQWQGGNNLATFQLRIKVSLTDGGIIVVHAFKGNFTDPAKLDNPEKQNLRLPLKFEAMGTYESIDGRNQLVLAKQIFQA